MCCLAKGECELLILALPPKCWGYRSVLPQQSWVVFKHVPLYLHEIVCLLFVLFIVCVHGMYKSENNFVGLVFFLLHMGPGGGDSPGLSLYLLNHLTGPKYF